MADKKSSWTQTDRENYWKAKAQEPYDRSYPDSAYNKVLMGQGKPPIGWSGNAMEPHHIWQRKDGGGNETSNLYPMERDTHRGKGNYNFVHHGGVGGIQRSIHKQGQVLNEMQEWAENQKAQQVKQANDQKAQADANQKAQQVKQANDQKAQADANQKAQQVKQANDQKAQADANQKAQQVKQANDQKAQADANQKAQQQAQQQAQQARQSANNKV